MYRLIRYSQPFATSAYRSPWTGFDLDSFFGAAASDLTRSIPVSLHEDKDNLQVSAELPGVDRADINIELLDDTLSLSATRKQGENVGFGDPCRRRDVARRIHFRKRVSVHGVRRAIQGKKLAE